MKPVNGENKHHKSRNKIDAMQDIDSVPSNVQSARQEALLYVFEDNEARPTLNLTARMPTVVSSSTSSSPVKRCYGNQDPWKSVVVDDRSGQPDKTSWNAVQQICHHNEDALLDGNAHSVRYAEMIHDGSGKPEKVNSQEGADSETFVMGSDEAEFEKKVKDQVRKRQKRMSNVSESGEEHSIILAMFVAATMNAATFMGKNFSTIENSS